MYRKKIAGPLINYTLDDERTMGTKKKKRKILEKVVQLTLPLTERI